MTAPARPGRIPDPIFVSHSHKDNEWCRAFVATLTAAGWDVWYDEQGLHGGAVWLAIIEKELAARPNFMPILTPDAWDSDWVQREIQLAMVERKQVIPVLHKATPQVSGFLKLIQWIDVIGLPAPIAAAKVALEMGYSLERRDTPPPPLPPDDPRFPRRLADLGYTALPNGDDIIILPPLCDIPAGPFLMGSDKRRDSQAYDRELPQDAVALAAYRIARYPVTVAEYACAVRMNIRPQPFDALGASWKQQLERMDHPVVNIAWDDANTYVRWLTERTSQQWRLPTEVEWEKAARGTDGRIYPWGDVWDRSCANTSDGGPNHTTPVGAYPRGASPYNVQDMAGNVWEWTSSLFTPHPYNPAVSEGLGKSTYARVLRGGSWNCEPREARVAFRVSNNPVNWNYARGFRLIHGSSAGAS